MAAPLAVLFSPPLRQAGCAARLDCGPAMGGKL